MLGPHQVISESDPIVRIHGCLAGNAGCLPAQDAGTLNLVVRLFVGEHEFKDWRGSFGRHLFMLRKFGLPPDTAIGRIIHVLAGFRSNAFISSGCAGW